MNIYWDRLPNVVRKETINVKVYGKLISHLFLVLSIDCLSIESKKPEIVSTSFVNAEMTVLLGNSVSMFCNILGLPDPEMRWYKNRLLIQNDTKIEFSSGMQTLKIENSTMEDSGEFKCVGENRLGKVEKLIELKIVGM